MRRQRKRLIQAVLLACWSAIAAYGLTPVHAQQGSQLFSAPVRADRAALSDTQQASLRALTADPTAADVQVVNLRIGLLRTLDTVTLNLPDTGDVPMDIVRIEQRSTSDYSWFGNNSQGLDEAILVVNGDQVYGTIRSGGKLHRVRPLDGGLHAIIRVDETKFPPEHPPEFKDVERDSGTRILREAMDPQAMTDACTEYRAIVAYTAGAETQAGNIAALIQLAVDETNQGYANSGVNTRIALAHTYQTGYTESTSMTTDRDRFRIQGDGHMDEVHGLRDQHQADVALLVTKSGGYCGIAAAIGAAADTAFAVVGQNCATGYYSFAHEVGHLQGARHNTEADSTNTPFAYGHGYYYSPASWRTIMSYNCPGNCTRLNYWSNPNNSRGGVAMGTATTNDNHRALNQTACQVANFRTAPAAGGGNALAFGVVLANGSKYSGTGNWTSTYNATYKRYEIRITGESYYYLSYATNVTPAGDVRYCRTTSVGGQLLVYCYDQNGNPATSRFGFATYKNP